MIYLELDGRIGNQLFMYAAARTLQLRCPDHPAIVVDDSLVKKRNWEDSLPFYELPGIEQFVADRSVLNNSGLWRAEIAMFKHKHITSRLYPTFRERYEYEVKNRDKFLKRGLVRCDNGYISLPNKIEQNVYMSGYFQSPKFFEENQDEIRTLFRLEKQVNSVGYPGLEQIQNRNSVCISIKIEHNVGSKMYDVCTREYWEQAIAYIIEKVEKPLFFVCSDNVPYVLEHFIDADKYDVILQNKDYPVHISLGVMAQCKHFIIGNTSFGWWAQYLATNFNKIVVAPSKWYGIDVPCDLYMDNWTLIHV